MSERNLPWPRVVGFRASSGQSADEERTVGRDPGGQRPGSPSQSTDRAEATAGRRLFGRQEVEDAVWMAFAHALPTRAEVVRVARRRGTRSELVALLERLASPQFAQLTEVWEEVDAAQRGRRWTVSPPSGAGDLRGASHDQA